MSARVLAVSTVLAAILALFWTVASQSPPARFNILVPDETAVGTGPSILVIDSATGAQARIASGGFFVKPSAVAVGPGGDLFVADYAAFTGGTGGVIRLSLDVVTGTWVQSEVSKGGVFKDPIDLTFDDGLRMTYFRPTIPH